MAFGNATITGAPRLKEPTSLPQQSGVESRFIDAPLDYMLGKIKDLPKYIQRCTGSSDHPYSFETRPYTENNAALGLAAADTPAPEPKTIIQPAAERTGEIQHKHPFAQCKGTKTTELLSTLLSVDNVKHIAAENCNLIEEEAALGAPVYA